MSRLYKNKFKTESTRLKKWDYSQNGFYFVTICTNNHQLFFGDVKKSESEHCPIFEMKKSPIGKIAEKYWLEIPKHFSNVKLDVFVIMPNHLHGVIEICDDIVIDKNKPCKHVETQQCCVSTTTNNESKTFYRLIPKSLPVIIRSFKSICTKTINQKFDDRNFSWQSKYYDHIIRDEKSLDEIRKYIIDNPAKWDLDKNVVENFYK
ncbi:MAG: transposase [Candidatus Pacebacteria bacterium]|nr:transposase [Candidatus Paceibacterota bacterium]